jgi:hypothetical protein
MPASGVQAAQTQAVDSTARLLAGLAPTHADHAPLAAGKTWQNHAAMMQRSWSQPRDGQLAAMKAWRKTSLPAQCPSGPTLLYPFSGPDFLNVYTLFPDCSTYVLFGLESVGVMPDPVAMTSQEFTQVLADMRRTMINLFARNYFVTTTMKKDFKSTHLRGILPVLAVSMALAGVEVIGIGPSPIPHATGRLHDLDGVTIDFRTPGSTQVRRLIYFSLDASDKSLADYPQFLDYLRKLAPTATLLKSASYLLHITEFRKMRETLLDVSIFLLQDDTGLPYAELRKRGWQMRVYGSYGVPIAPFANKYQKTLADAYAIGPAPALPFRFGYQRDQGDNYSSLMIGRRSTATAQSGTDAR